MHVILSNQSGFKNLTGLKVKKTITKQDKKINGIKKNIKITIK
jgi:hypothetical protein